MCAMEETNYLCAVLNEQSYGIYGTGLSLSAK
jgi:hypothetical protein